MNTGLIEHRLPFRAIIQNKNSLLDPAGLSECQ